MLIKYIFYKNFATAVAVVLIKKIPTPQGMGIFAF